MGRTQSCPRGSAAVAKRMWKESPIKSAVSLFSAVALAVGMTPLFAALGQVNRAYADTAPDVVVAPLVDRSGTGWNDGTDITNDCGVSVSATEDGNANVTVTYSATALQKHHNSEGTYAYWAGVAVPQESGCTYSTSWDGSNYTEDSSPIPYAKDGKNYYSFYFATYRPTLASKKGYIQVKSGDDVVKTYTIDFSGVTCVGDAVVAPLNDHGAAGATDTNADKRPAGYGCEQIAQDGVVTITLKGTGLNKHFNAQHKEAYWAGVGIPYTNATDSLELGYGTYSANAQPNAGTGTGSVDFTDDGTSYTSIYFDNAKVKSENGLWVRVKNGETTVAAYQIQSEITNNYAVTYEEAENGKISGVASAAEGDTVEIKTEPAKGYDIDTLKVTGDTVNKVVEVKDGKFTMLSSDVTVTATFKALDTSKLKAAVEAANEDLDNTKESTDGSDVDPSDKWTTKEARDTFIRSVSTASSGITMLQTQAAIDEAVNTLLEAQKTFDSAKKDGTKGIEPEPVVESLSMHRLYNPNSGEHFYTSNELEYSNLVGLGWKDEGTGWKAPDKSNTPVYRLYNANGGEHHFTMSKAERDYLVSIGWKDEGTGWYSDDAEGQVLYREYNPNAFANNHNYTTNKAEHDYLVSIGWKDEGTAWYGLAAS